MTLNLIMEEQHNVIICHAGATTQCHYILISHDGRVMLVLK